MPVDVWHVFSAPCLGERIFGAVRESDPGFAVARLRDDDLIWRQASYEGEYYYDPEKSRVRHARDVKIWMKKNAR
jgi:hypothetical protein